MLSVTGLLILAAGVCTIGNAVKGWPLWIPVLLLVIVLALGILPR